MSLNDSAAGWGLGRFPWLVWGFFTAYFQLSHSSITTFFLFFFINNLPIFS